MIIIINNNKSSSSIDIFQVVISNLIRVRV